MSQIAEQLAPLVKKPNTERVWRYLKDNPNKTPAELAVALGIPTDTVHATVYSMFKQRGMLSRQRSSRHGKGVWEYRALGNDYELLPLKTVRSPTVAATGPTPAPAPVQGRPVFDIEAYTLGELRTIYAQLSNLFKKV